ncbi:MAG: RNase adapter RapZ [Oscillospiraceae bacterium]|nr:RNase adapter RapZ [Oscillospiraceae bacterium]
MEFILISGLSGAGKSKAASFLEDMGFYVVDNMPAPLIPKFAELCMAGPGKYSRVCLVTDIRGGQTFEGLFDALNTLQEMGCAYNILFVEASVETIIKRYKETRRLHPLARSNRTLAEAVREEHAALAPVRQRAAYIIDTSNMPTAKLREEVLRLFGDGGPAQAICVNVISFGFKYGIPMEADLVLDVRFLPNPYYLAELRHKTGLDSEVASFVFGYQQTKDFMAHLEKLMAFLLPQYRAEGKTVLVIAIGCTGGQHRSVAITRALADFIKRTGYSATENHRDMTRGGISAGGNP